MNNIKFVPVVGHHQVSDYPLKLFKVFVDHLVSFAAVREVCPQLHDPFLVCEMEEFGVPFGMLDSSLHDVLCSCRHVQAQRSVQGRKACTRDAAHAVEQLAVQGNIRIVLGPYFIHHLSVDVSCEVFFWYLIVCARASE